MLLFAELEAHRKVYYLPIITDTDSSIFSRNEGSTCDVSIMSLKFTEKFWFPVISCFVVEICVHSIQFWISHTDIM